MFAHSYSKLSRTCYGDSTFALQKKFSFEMAAETWWWRWWREIARKRGEKRGEGKDVLDLPLQYGHLTLTSLLELGVELCCTTNRCICNAVLYRRTCVFQCSALNLTSRLSGQSAWPTGVQRCRGQVQYSRSVSPTHHFRVKPPKKSFSRYSNVYYLHML